MRRRSPRHLALYTIGHSSHTWPDFVRLLDNYKIELLVDTRSHPGSRHCPQFNREWMHRKLGDRYKFMGDCLGGRHDGIYAGPWPKQHVARKRADIKTLDKSKPAWWNQGFLDYSRWMASDEFKGGLHRLADTVRLMDSIDGRVAITCAEILWWHCHRSLIADAWEALGGEAYHILPGQPPQRHPLSDRLQRYEKDTRAIWRKNGRLAKELAL